MAIEKAIVTNLKTKLDDANFGKVIAEVWVRKLEIKVEATRCAMTREIIEYKRSEDLKQEVAEGCIEALHQGFLECKKKVRQFLPSLDLKDIVESNDEGEGEEGEGGEEVAEVKTELVGTEEMTIGVIAEEIAVVKEEVAIEAIAKAVTRTKAMVTKATKDSGTTHTSAPEE